MKILTFTIFIVSGLGATEPLRHHPNGYNRFATKSACEEALALVKDHLREADLNLYTVCLPSEFERE